MQLWSLLEADLRPPPPKSRHSRSQEKNNKWLGRTDLVTFDVFKRMYWRHLPQNMTKGIGVSLRSPYCYTRTLTRFAIQFHLWHSVTLLVQSCVAFCIRTSASKLLVIKGLSRGQRNRWSSQIALSTELHTRVSRTETTHCSKLIKGVSGSGVSATSRIGARSAQPVQALADPISNPGHTIYWTG